MSAMHEEAHGVSRRSFLGGTGVAAAAALAANAVAGGQAQATEAVPALSMGHINHVSMICTGCRTCEIMCSLTHEGLINPQRARNHVDTDIQAGHVVNVLYCQQCDDPKCLRACPTGALHIDEATGARVIDQDVCIGCQTCLNACYYAVVGQSRIKYNPETGKCIKCDLCGGEPKCVEYCPMGASQLSWKHYTITRPGIDDYVQETTEGAIEGVTFTKEYSGPHAAKATDEKPWALVATATGVKCVGSVTSNDGAILRVQIYADFYDTAGNLVGTSVKHQYAMSLHESMPIELEYDTADYSSIATVNLVANISYWVAGVDEEY